MSMLEELARKLVDALNDCGGGESTTESRKATEELDQYLLDMGKAREEAPEYVAHAKKMMAAYNDFDVDETPEVMTVEGKPLQRWVAAWVLIEKNPENGDMS